MTDGKTRERERKCRYVEVGDLEDEVKQNEEKPIRVSNAEKSRKFYVSRVQLPEASCLQEIINDSISSSSLLIG